jgi:peptide/nickel transport system substrate-binding protein
MLSATDLPVLQILAEVAADLMRRVGFNVDLQAMDWGTHPAPQQPWPGEAGRLERLLHHLGGARRSVPGSHQPIRGYGAAAWAGWPTIPKREELREAWFQAANLEAEKRIAEEIRRVVWQEVPFIPLGQVLPVQA